MLVCIDVFFFLLFGGRGGVLSLDLVLVLFYVVPGIVPGTFFVLRCSHSCIVFWVCFCVTYCIDFLLFLFFCFVLCCLCCFSCVALICIGLLAVLRFLVLVCVFIVSRSLCSFCYLMLLVFRLVSAWSSSPSTFVFCWNGNGGSLSPVRPPFQARGWRALRILVASFSSHEPNSS